MSSPNATPAPARPLWNPYVAGAFLGLMLLTTFVIMGFGLGASSGLTRFGVAGLHALFPSLLEGNEYLRAYVSDGTPIL